MLFSHNQASHTKGVLFDNGVTRLQRYVEQEENETDEGADERVEEEEDEGEEEEERRRRRKRMKMGSFKSTTAMNYKMIILMDNL